MRSEFIECETIEQAYDVCPWAAEIVEVEGGYRAFESIVDYQAWVAQR